MKKLLTKDEGVYKAGKKPSEMRGAVEVQEDEDTQIEVPIDQRPAEIVDEEENVARHNEEYSAMNGEADPGEETGETVNEMEKNKEKMDDHSENEQPELDEAGEGETSHARGGTNEENGEEMDHNGHEEETKGSADDPTQDDAQKASTPRVTITSPQESEKNEQTNDYAAVA
ncbi:UNVERIFIED_CONTAM: Doublecortin domain-containing protein 2 [Gekko kuhli]